VSDSGPIPLPAPSRTFASDNSASVHPDVVAAITDANDGHAIAYGNDERTARVQRGFRALFGADAETFLVWGGTGGNVVALASLWRPGGAVLCTDCAHIHEDETAAPERMIGMKVIPFPNEGGKLTPEHIERQVHHLGDQHRPQACAISLTQATEFGTVYSPAEVRALCETAHRHGMSVHMDGARIANAVAHLGTSPEVLRSMTTDAGVDVITFGGTKNGMMYGEAVVFLTPGLAAHTPYARKQAAQLPSKMRFVSAQFEALLDGDRWIALGRHANAMAARLFDGVSRITGLDCRAPQANSLYPILPRAAAQRLQAWCPFYEWDHAQSQYRWMTAWDTTPDDVDRFVAGVRYVLQ